MNPHTLFQLNPQCHPLNSMAPPGSTDPPLPSTNPKFSTNSLPLPHVEPWFFFFLGAQHPLPPASFAAHATHCHRPPSIEIVVAGHVDDAVGSQLASPLP